MDKQRILQLSNYYKFYIVKKLHHKNFIKFGEKYIKGLILDVGSGYSPFKKYIKNGNVISVDSNSDVNPDIVGSIYSLPFKDNTFDGIICTDVLEHLEDPVIGVKEMKRVLKVNGYIYITVPMLWCLHYEPKDFFRFTKYGITYILEKEGFKIEKVIPVGKIFSYLAARICEKFYNMINKIIFFLPKQNRFIVTIPVVLPFLFFLYYLTLLLDKLNKRDVYSWCVIARK